MKKKKREKYEADKKKQEEEKKIFLKNKEPIMKKITKLVKSAKFRTKNSFNKFLTFNEDNAFYGANNWVGDLGLKKAKERYLEFVDNRTESSDDFDMLPGQLSALEKFK